MGRVRKQWSNACEYTRHGYVAPQSKPRYKDRGDDASSPLHSAKYPRRPPTEGGLLGYLSRFVARGVPAFRLFSERQVLRPRPFPVLLRASFHGRSRFRVAPFACSRRWLSLTASCTTVGGVARFLSPILVSCASLSRQNVLCVCVCWGEFQTLNLRK